MEKEILKVDTKLDFYAKEWETELDNLKNNYHKEIDKIENGYFFESDILFRLNTIRAVVYDIPIEAIYGDEQSGLNIRKIINMCSNIFSIFCKLKIFTFYIIF